MFSYKALKPRTRLSSGRAGCAPLCGLPPTRTTIGRLLCVPENIGAASAYFSPQRERNTSPGMSRQTN